MNVIIDTKIKTSISSLILMLLWQTNQVELRSDWCGTIRCVTSDGRNVNMAEELNRLEKELINGMD